MDDRYGIRIIGYHENGKDVKYENHLDVNNIVSASILNGL